MIGIHIILFLLVTKFLVATGKDYDGNNIRRSEIIDLSYDGAGNQCFDWADYPLDVFKASGGLIEDQVVICGGQKLGGFVSSDCYSISGHTSTFITKMSVKRHSAASIVLDSNTLWITGGYYDYLIYDSSEFIQLEGSNQGPTLAMPVHAHAMILLNDTFSMIIGGQNELNINKASALTFYYDHQINQWLNGPALIQARDSHAVGIITDENTMEKLLIVTGGVSYGVLIYATEILIENQWNLGKKDC